MTSKCGAASILFVLFCVAPSSGALITYFTDLNAFDGRANQGWWSDVDVNFDDNHNYFVGNYITDHRSFFSFDLSSLGPTDIITSATLRLRRFNSSTDNEATETIGIFDVSTPAAILNDNDGFSAPIFADLGSGTSYGAFDVPGSGLHSDILSFTLNASALSDLNASKGSFFSLGIALTSQNDGDYLFGAAGIFPPADVPAQQLVLDVEPLSAVPEPTTLVLLMTAAPIVVFVRLVDRRRKRKLTVSA